MNKPSPQLTRLTTIVLGLLTIVTLLFLTALAFNWFPALRGPDDWRWTYIIPGKTWRQLVPIVVVVIYVAMVLAWGNQLAKSKSPSRKSLIFYLFVLALFVPVIQLSLLVGETDNVIEQLYFRTISWGSSGFFSTGSIIDDPRQFLTDYPALMPTFPVHPQRYPPGISLLFYLTRRMLNSWPDLANQLGSMLRLYQCQDLTLMRIPPDVMASGVLQMLLPFITGLTIFPLFGLARRTINWETAVWSVSLYPILPSFALWAGKWDQFFPLPVVTAWYLLVVGLTQKRLVITFLAGVVMSIATFLSFGLLVMLMPMGIWALGWSAINRPKLNWPRVILDGLLFVIGLASLWIVYELLFGTGIREIWQVSMSYHLNLSRSYWTWIGYHLYDFGIFLSLPIAIFCLFGIFYAALTVRQYKAVLPIAFGLGLFLLDIADVARGEVARVWIFLTPFAAICAAWGLTILAQRKYQRVWFFSLIALQLLVFSAFLRVVNTGVDPVMPRSYVTERPFIVNPRPVQFGNTITLLGYDLAPDTLSAGDTLQATLYWQPTTFAPKLYTMFTHLTTPDGQLIAQQDNMPVNNTLPTTCWVPDEIIIDRYTLPLQQDVNAGTYTLHIGVYDSLTGQRLPVTENDIPLGNSLTLPEAITITAD